MPEFGSLDQLVEFFDAHDMGEYWAEMPEAKFEIDIKRTSHLVALDSDLAEKVTEIARKKRISTKNLINKWLREKVLEQDRTQ